jgi:hypothetical protein
MPKVVKNTVVKVLVVMAQDQALTGQEGVEFERTGHRKALPKRSFNFSQKAFFSGLISHDL